MSLEKIGLLFLLNYLNQLGTVKDHLLLAVREMLLAMQASVDIVSQTAGKTLLGNRGDFVSPLVKQVQGVLNYTIEKVTPENGIEELKKLENGFKLKANIVESIVSAINDEIENISDTSNEKNKLKIEALNTVKQVLMHQKKSSRTKEAAKSANVA